MGKMKELRNSINLLFVDFKSAYDSIDREQMYVAVNVLNIPQKLISLVRMIMCSSRARIKFSRSPQHRSHYTRVSDMETQWRVYFLV